MTTNIDNKSNANMNSKLDSLQPYPFEKMAKLLADCQPSAQYSAIKLGIGEPKHQPPQIVIDELVSSVSKVQNYPTTGGIPELSATIASWLSKRFSLTHIDALSQVMPVMGTREAIFSFIQASINDPAAAQDISKQEPSNQDDEIKQAFVVMPNPFYQIYEGGAILAGAQPYYVPCNAEHGFNPDYRQVPEQVWQKTQLVFACSPNNPTGAVVSEEDWQFLLAMSDKYGFILASDECYSELYFDKPPLGLLEVCAKLGRDDYKNCIVFHSLSKRSNLPGLRSGFIAGDASLLQKYASYRTYQGCAMPIHHQQASIVAWSDEAHVEENRVLYREKFALWMRELGDLLQLRMPDAGFYLWVKVPEKFANDDELFVRALYQQVHVHALAGSYLSRDFNGNNPGKGFVRLALVASVAENLEAIERIKKLL